MIFSKGFRHTSFTFITMENLVASSNSTNTTFVTMLYIFPILFIVIEITYATKIACKFYFAVFTTFSWRALNDLTLHTFNLSDFTKFHLMILLRITLIVIMNLIMAFYASVKLFTFWTSQLTFSQKVLAPDQNFSILFVFFPSIFIIFKCV